MMSKTIIAGLVVVAFVAGSIMTGTMVYASGDKNGKPFEALWDAVHALEAAVEEIDEQGSVFDTYVVRTDDVDVIANKQADATASCDPGDMLLSGGHRVSFRDVNIKLSYPDVDNQEWVVVGENPTRFTQNINAFALCADFEPLRP